MTDEYEIDIGAQMGQLMRDAAMGKILEDSDTATYKRWGWRPSVDLTQKELERDREEFRLFHNAGIEVFHRYAAQLAACQSRDQVEPIRAAMRADREFILYWPVIERASAGPDWWRGAIRAEARRAEREGAELLAQIKAEEAARKEADEAQMKSNPIFGMF